MVPTWNQYLNNLKVDDLLSVLIIINIKHKNYLHTFIIGR